MLTLAYIEDSEEDAMIFERWAARKGHNVSHFTSTEDFISSKTQFDLVITDLDLGEDFGVQIVNKIRKAKPYSRVLILTGMASGHLTGDICKKLMDAGALNVVPKDMLNDPVMPYLLEEAVNEPVQ